MRQQGRTRSSSNAVLRSRAPTISQSRSQIDMSTKTARRMCIALAACVALAPLISSADSLSNIQAQIQTLLAQIAQLQQLGTAAAPTAPAATVSTGACFSLNRTLSQGLSGSDVASLQTFLAGEGYFSGNATGFFGPITEAAVQRFQSAHGIVSSGDPASTGYGVVGPRTGAAITQACTTAPVPAQSAPSCPIAPQPATLCSTGWQAVTDVNGCTTSYKCSIPLPGANVNNCPVYQAPTCGSGYTPPSGGPDSNGCRLPQQ